MIRVTERSHVPAPPERTWAFFADLESNYLDWHPEHVEFRAIRDTPVVAGSVYFFDEWIGRFRLRTRVRVAETRKNRYLRHEGMFPYSLLRAGGSLAFESAGGGVRDVVAEVYIGWDVPVLGVRSPTCGGTSPRRAATSPGWWARFPRSKPGTGLADRAGRRDRTTLNSPSPTPESSSRTRP